MFNNEVRDTYVAVAQAIFFMLGFVTSASPGRARTTTIKPPTGGFLFGAKNE